MDSVERTRGEPVDAVPSRDHTGEVMQMLCGPVAGLQQWGDWSRHSDVEYHSLRILCTREHRFPHTVSILVLRENFFSAQSQLFLLLCVPPLPLKLPDLEFC